MPAIHLFPTSKIPFFFTLSFFIDSYCKNKKKVWICCAHYQIHTEKCTEVLYSTYSNSSEYKVKKEESEVLDLF